MTVILAESLAQTPSSRFCSNGCELLALTRGCSDRSTFEEVVGWAILLVGAGVGSLWLPGRFGLDGGALMLVVVASPVVALTTVGLLATLTL
ncbi:MAG: hypothetical protein R3A46_10285 [Thermomicrobiales bacterium]